MIIRPLSIEEYDALYSLWISSPGVGLRQEDDSREGIERYLKRNPTTCFAAEENGRLAGALLCGHDGRRGIISHTAVHPDFRRRGVATALCRAAEDALRREGIHKVFLVAFTANEAGNVFWEKMGYTLRPDLNYRNHSL